MRKMEVPLTRGGGTTEETADGRGREAVRLRMRQVRAFPPIEQGTEGEGVRYTTRATRLRNFWWSFRRQWDAFIEKNISSEDHSEANRALLYLREMEAKKGQAR